VGFRLLDIEESRCKQLIISYIKSGCTYTSLISVYPHSSIDILRLSKLNITVSPEHKLTENPLLLKRNYHMITLDYTIAAANLGGISTPRLPLPPKTRTENKPRVSLVAI
jgi:hypothetical protein